MKYSCSRCDSKRIMCVNGKVSDSCWMESLENRVQYDGYVPSNLGIGGSDYIEFDYCLDCGQIQDKNFPFKLTAEFLEDSEEDW